MTMTTEIPIAATKEPAVLTRELNNRIRQLDTQLNSQRALIVALTARVSKLEAANG